jgi:ABC-type transport system involved in multi-copper enzyme maturation permease subunit
MVLAIVTKELRETRIFAALALGAYFIYLSKLTGRWGQVLTQVLDWLPGMDRSLPEIPFVDDKFLSMYGFIGITLAIALGFRQSAWEPSQGTALYLLHLPLSRHALFLTKLLTGIGLQLACTLIPILMYATWAAMPRTHPGPFEWSMTGPAFCLWLIMPLVYLSAFASGIRPARWFGSRLLPLAAVAVPAFFLEFALQWRWLIGFPLLLLMAAVLVSNILLEAETRDF